MSWWARYISSTGRELFRQKKSWLLVQDFADDDRNAHDIIPYDTFPRYSTPSIGWVFRLQLFTLKFKFPWFSFVILLLVKLSIFCSAGLTFFQVSLSLPLFQIIFLPTVLVHVFFKWNLLLYVVYVSHNFKPTYILYLDDDQLSLTQHPLKMSGTCSQLTDSSRTVKINQLHIMVRQDLKHLEICEDRVSVMEKLILLTLVCHSGTLLFIISLCSWFQGRIEHSF